MISYVLVNRPSARIQRHLRTALRCARLALCVYLDCLFFASDRLSIAGTGRDAAAISIGEGPHLRVTVTHLEKTFAP